MKATIENIKIAEKDRSYNSYILKQKKAITGKLYLQTIGTTIRKLKSPISSRAMDLRLSGTKP